MSNFIEVTSKHGCDHLKHYINVNEIISVMESELEGVSIYLSGGGRCTPIESYEEIIEKIKSETNWEWKLLRDVANALNSINDCGVITYPR